MIKGRTVWVIALLALLAAACGAGPESVGGEPNTAPSPDTAPPTTLEPVDGAVQPADPVDGEPDPGAPLTELPAVKISRAMQPIADLAVADLAAHLGVPAATITVAVAETVVWPDGSLGCPQPAMVYTQVLTDGSRIVLVHGGRSYSYHSGGSTPDPFLCESPSN